MKILYVSYDDLARDGAPTIHVAAIANRLAEAGHEVRLVAPDGDLSPEIRVPHLPMTRPGGFFSRLFWHFFGSCLEIAYWGFKFRPDIIYVRGIHATPAPILASRLLWRPCVVEVNGLLEAQTRSWWRRFLVRWNHRITLWLAKAVVTVSPLLKEGLCRRYGVRDDKVFVVPNGADGRRIRPGNRAEARGRLGLPANGSIVLYVGGFYPHHGLDLLVECAPKVLARVPTATFVLVGEGASRKELEAKVRESGLDAAIVFAGGVPHETVPDYLAAADACVYLLRNTYGADFGFSPLKVYEYMAAGRAIVAATDMEDIRTFVNGNGIGLAEPLEAGRLADAIVRVLSDAGLRERFGAHGRALAVAAYSWDRACEQVERVLKGAL